ncbi:MAG: sulfurtransferase TusA family protein [Chloroflexi bacterium]|nr:sulfurtransferase TusA family protein [Chloroflexota bacterium]
MRSSNPWEWKPLKRPKKGRSSTVKETSTSDNCLDLRGVLCPMNWVKTKLILEEKEEGEVLEVIVDEGEPMRNVPRSAKQEGHKIVKVEELEDHAYKLTIRRGAD